VKTVLFVLHLSFTGLTSCPAFGGSVVTESPQETAAVRGQIQLVARKQYSNPPIHGALLVSKVLSDPALKQQWYKEVKVSATAPQYEEPRGLGCLFLNEQSSIALETRAGDGQAGCLMPRKLPVLHQVT
jgi:hypothetical protein